MTYANVLSDSVSGNPDDLSDTQLHEKAWPFVEAHITAKRQNELSRWEEAAHTELGGTDLEEIVTAAHDGRVDTLYVQADHDAWGTFDPDGRSVSLAEEATAENYDLIDLAAIKTLRADGRVVVVTDPDSPLASCGAAAIFRYATAPQTT